MPWISMKEYTALLIAADRAAQQRKRDEEELRMVQQIGGRHAGGGGMRVFGPFMQQDAPSVPEPPQDERWKHAAVMMAHAVCGNVPVAAHLAADPAAVAAHALQHIAAMRAAYDEQLKADALKDAADPTKRVKITCH
jgi:hypothetical protein